MKKKEPFKGNDPYDKVRQCLYQAEASDNKFLIEKWKDVLKMLEARDKGVLKGTPSKKKSKEFTPI